MKDPKKIDAENKEFYKQSYDDVVSGKWSIRDIIGFETKEPRVFVLGTTCAHLAPSIVSHCEHAREKPVSSILTLLPTYNTLLYPIISKFGGKKMSEAAFKDANDMSLTDFLKVVERGRIIPYFTTGYQAYDTDFLHHFLDTGVPRISRYHMELIKRQNSCKLVDGDCKKCHDASAFARKDLPDFFETPALHEEHKGCTGCLAFAYCLGIKKDAILQVVSPSPQQTLCAIVDVVASRNTEAVFQTNCPIGAGALGLFTGVSGIENAIEAIVDGLRIKYTPDLHFESYLELLDGKTTRAVREIIKKILEDPFAAKYSERLNSRIFAFNREVEEVAKTRTAKFYHAISDITVYGGNKFIERQTQGYLQARKKDLRRVSEWMASKLMDIHAKVTGKDWTIAQLYRTRCKIEQCKVPSEPKK